MSGSIEKRVFQVFLLYKYAGAVRKWIHNVVVTEVDSICASRETNNDS
jgi:hypothetical protein